MAAPSDYCLASRIPAQLRSADLRSYFSQAVEAGAFLRFHYRHRPEPGEGGPSPGPTRCCLVVVRPGWACRLVRMYSGKRWIDAQGETLPGRCLIRRVRVSPDEDVNSFPYKTKKELHKKASSETFTEDDLKQLPELNPPAFMPYGNVGTPLRVFLELINTCRMPARAIRKLQLQFPKTGSSRRYGNVPFTYEKTETVVGEERVYTATGEEIMEGEAMPQPGGVPVTEDKDWETLEKEAVEEDCCLDKDDDRGEEWERHEALHEDVTSQEHAKERLFEEEIELKWEKGGSGLVFYTDAQYWQEEEGGGVFDEQTADDWDVDMSIYYDKDGGDKDARDLVQMRLEQRLRDGMEDGSLLGQQIGTFEKYTKGIGRKVMERQGWTEGLGLGSSNSGMAEALDNEGQNPKCKRGLGYHGEKLQTFIKPKTPRGDGHVLISTIYDDPHPVDEGEQLLRRPLPISMKYRKDMTFVHAANGGHLSTSSS